MAEQENDLKGSINRRTLMKSVSAALVLGGYLAPNELSGEDTGARKNGEPKPASKTLPKQATTTHKKYPHLLSPIKVGTAVLKNRMIHPPCSPHFLLGPEPYPNAAISTHYANKARSGASIVVLSQNIDIPGSSVNQSWQWAFNGDTLKAREAFPNIINPDHGTGFGHFQTFDLVNGGAQNMLSQLTEAIHFYDSLCLMKPKIETPEGYDVSPGAPSVLEANFLPKGKNFQPEALKKEITEEMLQKIIEEMTNTAVLAKEVGFDGFFIHMAYRSPLTARFLSPLTNFRRDKYGGSLENRARFNLNLVDAIKKRCGEDFILVASMSGHEPEGGYTLDDAAEYARMFTGHLDMIDIKGDPGERDSAPTNFIRERTPFLYMTEAIKKKGVTIPLACDGGFQDLDACEEAIASGKTDIVGVARAWIVNPNFGELAYEGRNEDVIPCLRCNECHGGDFFKPWNSTCAINPIWGLEHKIDSMISPPQFKKTVAVIGGGPAGMEAALIAVHRGHKVTLFEKSGSLGGLFTKFEDVYFKWPHKDYKNYMVRHIAKSRITVRLNTEANPAMIKKEGYDVVIVALGAEPIVPDIPGIKSKNVVYATGVFGKEDSLANDVVIIGGGSTGTETGMHLADKGHRVTVLEATSILARDAVRIHYYSALQNAWEKLPNFKFILEARCNGISEDGVAYIDADGKQHSINAGSVVVATGMKARTDLALTFQPSCDRFSMVGDCKVAADVQGAIRAAFAAASTI